MAKTIDLLRWRSSLKTVAEDTGTSLSGVSRVLNALAVPRPKALPEAISFDEFKGNLGGERFQCIVTAPLNHRVLDILSKRTVESIQDYLRAFPNMESYDSQIHQTHLLAAFPFWHPLISFNVVLLRLIPIAIATMKNTLRILYHFSFENRIKRAFFGCQNFSRFRKRISYLFLCTPTFDAEPDI